MAGWSLLLLIQGQTFRWAPQKALRHRCVHIPRFSHILGDVGAHK